MCTEHGAARSTSGGVLPIKPRATARAFTFKSRNPNITLNVAGICCRMITSTYPGMFSKWPSLGGMFTVTSEPLMLLAAAICRAAFSAEPYIRQNYGDQDDAGSNRCCVPHLLEIPARKNHDRRCQ